MLRSAEKSRLNWYRKEEGKYYYYYYIDDEEPQEFPVFVGLRKCTSRAWLDPEM